VGNTVTSYYTPQTPVVSNISSQYGQPANLIISSADTLYWYDSLTGGNLLHTGNQYITPSLYDTTVYYIEAQRTIPLTSYQIGSGIAINQQNQFPTPYGSLSYGAKHQFLIKASEMQNMGMIQGYIESLSFNVQAVNGNPLQGYEIQIGTTGNQALTSFIGNLTPVFYSSYYTETLGWNVHQFNTPFYWDGVSNVVIQTCFKNSSWGQQTASVYQDTTSYYSSIHSYGASSFSCSDTAVSYYHYRRPAVQFNSTGFGHCISDREAMQINITGFPQLDAGLTQILNPVGTAPNGSQVPVSAILKNYGSSNLTSATLNWQVNNITQTAVNWTGNLSNNQTDTINLGNYTFDGGIENILIWVSNPNNSTDTIQVNDSVYASISVCMGGTYAIGSAQPEYQTITDAVNMLLQVGVCGNVTFNIDSGLYSEQLTIPYIPGTGPNSNVTFTSANNDSSTVTVTAINTQADNYVIKLDSASFINIRNITIAANGSIYGNAIMLINGTSNIAIENNVIKSTTTSVYNSSAYGIYNYSQDIHHINIINNEFQNGYHGLYLTGSSNSRIHNINIDNNYLHDFYQAGLYLYYIDTLNVSNNFIMSGYTSSYYYGMRFHNNEDQWTINANDIRLYPTSYGSGIEIEYSDGSSSNYGNVYNNFISIHSGSGINKGLYFSQSDYVKISFNSINITDGSATSRAIYTANSGSNLKCLNNIFAVQNQGYAAYVNSASVVSVFDHNCLFVGNPSGNYAYWSGAVANLASLKLMDLTKNINSVDINPYFLNSTDLHTYEFGLNSTGIPIGGISTDIDGETRDPINPDIGADEFNIIPTDIGIISMIHPSVSSCGYSTNDSVVISVRNMGSDTIFFSSNPVEIKVFISGIISDTLSKIVNTGYIIPGAFQNIVVDNNVNLSLNGQFVFNATTILSNDTNFTNDVMLPLDIISYPTINSFPFSEDFESGMNKSFFEIVGTESKLSVDNNSNNGGQYGLHFEGRTSSGFTNYADVIQAYSNASHVAHAATCNIDATGISGLNMKFDLKQTYSQSAQPNYSWFRVMVTDISGTHYLKNINGDSVFQAATPNQDIFTTQIFNLNQWSGQIFNISLESACRVGFGLGSFDGDNSYVDNFSIWAPNTTDASVSSFLQPGILFTQVGTQVPVEVIVTNFGTDTLWSIPVGYHYGNTPPVYDSINQMLLPNASDTFAFSVPFTVIQGDHPICVYTLLPGDNISANDTLCYTFKGIGIYQVDYIDDFENLNNWVSLGTTNLWQLGQPNSANINNAHSGTTAWETNLSGNYVPGMIDYLYSPFITIPTYADTATLEFWQWMEVLSTHGYGKLQYSLNGGNSWINLGYMFDPLSTNWYNSIITGQHYWSINTNGWIKSSYKLDPAQFNTGNPVQFRFEFISDGSLTTYDGWAIDDFSVTIPPLADDAGISQIIYPVNQTITGDTIAVTVEIKNFGSDTLTNIPVGYFSNMAGSVNETWSGTLLPDSTTIFTFSTSYIAYNQDYDICAFTAITTDNQPSNDTLCLNIQSLAGDKDAGVIAIVTPTGQTTIGNNVDVKATIQNFGIDTLFSIPIEYSVSGSPISQETFTGIILPGLTTDFTFTTTYTSPGGLYYVCVSTSLNGDVDVTNDTLCLAVTGTGIESNEAEKFRVSQNRPNPANDLTTFTFNVPSNGKVLFNLYNILGEKIKSVELNAVRGKNTITFDVSSFTNGVYLSSFEYEGLRITKRVVVGN